MFSSKSECNLDRIYVFFNLIDGVTYALGETPYELRGEAVLDSKAYRVAKQDTPEVILAYSGDKRGDL